MIVICHFTAYADPELFILHPSFPRIIQLFAGDSKWHIIPTTTDVYMMTGLVLFVKPVFGVIHDTIYNKPTALYDEKTPPVVNLPIFWYDKHVSSANRTQYPLYSIEVAVSAWSLI